MRICFIETRRFTSRLEALNLTVDDLIRLQDNIGSAPTANPVVPGTGGLRKTRFASLAGKRGKRGGFRVGYAYFEEFGVVVLVLVYSKNRKGDLTPAEKKLIKSILQCSKKEFERLFGQ
jgi:mRNA-degrading endonuclease RelE of RelBE toxin-antitoxin system